MTDDNHFRRLWDLGYRRLVPIVPPNAPLSERSSLYKRLHAKTPDDARGKVPGVRWPDGTWSGFDWVPHEATEADLDRWHAMGAGVGIKTGDGLALIDADTWDEGRAKIIRDIIEDELGFLPPVRVGQYPKAGYLIRTRCIYRRIEFGERDERGRLKERVEILSDGRQFVAVGIHPKTGKPYRWPKGLPPIAEIPEVTEEQLDRILRRCAEALPSASELIVEGAGSSDVDQATLRGSLDTVREAVEAIRNTSEQFPSRESYRDFGYAIKAACGPEHEAEALNLFLDWCARWEDGENDLDVARADWGRMKGPFRRGASWLYELAGFDRGRQVAERFFDPSAASAAEADSLFPQEPAAPARKFQFLPFDTAADTALDDHGAPLIKGLLDQGAMTILYGPSNVGKTFVAMDIAYHVAAGLDYAGMKTARGCVIYVAAEGGRGAKRRVRALRDKFPGTDVQFLLLPASIDLRRPDADLRPLISAIGDLGVPVLLIVVDTLSRAMAGGDENSSVDMGHIVTHFDALRAHTAAHLLVVHHSGKNIAAGARGHSLLRAATDTEIEVGEGVIEVTKQRDLDKSWSSGFALEVRTLGVDRDGDPITSCTVRLVGRDSAEVARATERESAVVADVTGLDDGEGVTAEDVAGAFEARGDKMSVSAARAMLKNLVAKNLIAKAGRGKWKALQPSGAKSYNSESVKVAENASATLISYDVSEGQVAESGRPSGRSVFS